MGSLGDTVMVLPCLNKIKELFPEADLLLLTNKPVSQKAAAVASILPKGFFSKELYYLVGTRNIFDLLKLFFQIKELKANLFINLTAARSERSTARDKVFFKLTGIPKQIGFPLKNDYNILRNPETGKTEWEADRLKRRIVELGDINLYDNKYWDLHISESEEKSAEYLLSSLNTKSFIAISTGTKVQANDWEIKNWTVLIKKLFFLLKGWGLVILGAENDKIIADKLLEYWPSNAINLCGKTSPRISAAILKHAKFFVGHDSGPLHLAAAFNIPGVGIYSARNLPGRWYPRGDSNTILYHEVECAGCGLQTCIIMEKKCLLSISVDEVYNAIIKRLKLSGVISIYAE